VVRRCEKAGICGEIGNKYVHCQRRGYWTIGLLLAERKFVFGDGGSVRLSPGTYYLHLTWAHVMLLVLLGYLTLNSGAHSHFCQLCLRHVIWRGALVGSHASTPLKFLLSHTFRDGTRCRTGVEVNGKLANGVGSQYSSHYLGTWCIQHYYCWCTQLGCQ
jgi:hypothetical protein